MNTGNDGSRLVAALEQLGVHDHLCLVYENRLQQFGAVIPFMRMGLQRGERCVYIADDNTAADVLQAMKAAGIDIESATASGALAVITKKEAYLKEGYFDPDLMIRFLKETVDDAKAQGYHALRATGEMTWALGGETGVGRLMEYEAKLNYFFPEHDIVALCQYSRTRFSPEIIADVIRTHPLVIYGDMVCRNMYYEPPDDFLTPGKADRDVERLLNNIRAREAAEAALRTQEAEFREAQRVGRIGSWDWDAAHDTIAWSEEYYRIYGIDPGKRPPGYEEHLKVYTPESAARLDAAVKKSLQTGEPYELELELADQGAPTRWISARGEVKRDADGRTTGLRGTAQDITALKKNEAHLRSAYHKLESSLEENRVLLREVQHRVKNNLQTMISLLRLQATWTEDGRVVEMLNESQNRIRAMALVHEKLSQAKDFAHIQYSNYIGDLAKSLLSAYSATAHNIALELDIDDVSLGLDTAMHLGLIINELITNSLKHAFPHGRNGVIRIMLKRPAHGEDYHELVVKDNGIGMPGSVDLRESKTMGLYLVTNLAETQLRGHIELIRNRGTEFRIRFKGV